MSDMNNDDIKLYTAEDHNRFMTGIGNGLLLSIPLWAVIGLVVYFFII